MTTKIDFINKAYSRGKISGLTVSPSPEDISLALDRLENMAAEWEELNLCTGYTFEDNPQVNTLHNVPRKYWNAFELSLMMCLLADFGKEPTAALASRANTSFSRMSASLAVVRQVNPPARHPIGRGNRRWGRQLRHTFGVTERVPVECASVYMDVGDINDFYEDYSSYLLSGETIISAVITTDTGLAISALPTLAIGTTPTAVSNTAFKYFISGVAYNKAAVPAGTAPGNDVIPQSKYGAVALDIDTAGTITVAEATANATGYDSASLAIAGIPDVVSSKYRMGTVTVIDDTHIFTFGLTSLADASSTVVYTDNNIIDSRVIYTVTANGDIESGVAQVVIVATMSSGRVETRLRNFNITTVEIA